VADKYAVIGNPITHSKSPFIFRAFAAQTGEDIEYVPLQAPLDGFADFIERVMDAGYKGVNVTAPFKQEAYNLANDLTYAARVSRSANMLTFEGDSILADSTDGDGLMQDIRFNLGISLIYQKKVLLIGAGGAARSIALQLSEEGTKLVIANRTVEKAMELASEYHNVEGCGFDTLSGRKFDIVINATSTGFQDIELPLPVDIFADHALAYDIAYGRMTPFMKFAETNGVSGVYDGLGMLVEQAAQSFYIWRGKHPDTHAIIRWWRKVQ
jgi:shikimate dehydrogenase